jgi:hypothetical protein
MLSDTWIQGYESLQVSFSEPSRIRSVCIISCGSEEVFEFLRREAVDEVADGAPQALDGSLRRLSQQRLKLCEGVLDGIEVGAVWREVEEARAGAFNQFPHFRPLWLDRLSMITLSPLRGSGTRTLSM